MSLSTVPRFDRRRGKDQPHRRLPRGFSLLELMVVLVILGLLTTLVAPNLQGLYEGITRDAERNGILDRFDGLGREAMLRGRAFVVSGTVGEQAAAYGPAREAGFEPYALELPEGWEVSLDQPLFIRANGICLGAELTLVHRGEKAARMALDAPYCRVEADT